MVLQCNLFVQINKFVYSVLHEKENLSTYEINTVQHGKCFQLYDFYSLVDTYQKTHSFATLTRSFSDTTQLVNKNRTRAFSMK